MIAQVVVLPPKCPAGHIWSMRTAKGFVQVKCGVKVDKDFTEAEGKRSKKRVPCSRGTTWRTKGSLQEALGRRITPQGLSILIFSFSQRMPIEQASQESGVPTKTCRKAYRLFRRELLTHMQRDA